MVNLKRVRKVMIILLLVFVFVSLVYAYFQSVGVEEGVFDRDLFVGSSFKFVGLFSLLFLIVYFAIYFFSDGVNGSDLSVVKEVLPSSVVIDCWVDSFVRHTGIPYVSLQWVPGRVKPILFDRDCVVVMEEVSFSDPEKETSDTFITFEAYVTSGSRQGLFTVTSRTDMGRDWVRDNYNWRIVRVSSLSYRPKSRLQPLTSAADARERLLSKKLDLLEEGRLTPEELSYIDTLEASLSSVASKKVVGKNVGDGYAASDDSVDDDSDDDSSSDGVEADIKAYQEENK